MMFIVYVGNIFQAVLLYIMSIKYCRDMMTTAPPGFHTYQCFQYSQFVGVFFILTAITWIILTLSTWNSIRCQRNFGKNLEHYSKLILFHFFFFIKNAVF